MGKPYENEIAAEGGWSGHLLVGGDRGWGVSEMATG